MSRINTIIFDMDGVVVDSEALHAASHLKMSDEVGLPRHDRTEFRGMKVDEIMKIIHKRYKPKVSWKEMLHIKNEHFIKLAEQQLELFDGVVQVVAFSREKFEKVGLATSSPRSIQKSIFGQFGLDKYFDAVVTAEDIDDGKPHPAPYKRAMKLLGSQPSETVVIEDSYNGIKSAQAAGCKVIAIATTHSVGDLSIVEPDIIAPTMERLAFELEKL